VACADSVFEMQWGGVLFRVHTPTYAPFWASFAKKTTVSAMKTVVFLILMQF